MKKQKLKAKSVEFLLKRAQNDFFFRCFSIQIGFCWMCKTHVMSQNGKHHKRN
jgi:hypothetical protein